MQANVASTDVMIIGAGPVGLFAALRPDKKLRFQYTTSAPAPRILLRAA
jgi:aspartate oxidase